MTLPLGMPTGKLSLAAAAVTVLLALLQGSQPGVSAEQSADSISRVAVDANVQGNTATSLGKSDTCARIASGQKVDVDITVDAVPASRPMTAFQIELLYDPAVVKVTARNQDMLLASNEDYNPVISLTDRVPDTDGDFLIAVADFSTGTDVGPGVLARVTLTAVAAGVVNLSPANPDIRDDLNEEVPVTSMGAAYLAVDQACPSTAPTPVTPTPHTDGEDGGDNGTPPAGEGTPGATPGTDGTPGSNGTPLATPGPGTPGSTPGVGDVSQTPRAGDDGTGSDPTDRDGDDGGGGVGAWIAAPIAAGALLLLGGGYFILRRRGLWGA